MRIRSAIVCGGLILLCGAVGLRAQMRGMQGWGAPAMSGLWHPVVGSGAVYDVDRDGNKTTFEMDIVGKESVAGKDAVWVEFSFSDARMGTVFAKSLVGVEGQQVQTVRTIMQMGGMPPMEMPQSQSHTTQVKDIHQNSTDLGSESVTVPAGTFTCEHYKTKEGADVWVSEKVVPVGLIKSVEKGETVVLLKTVTDAKDKIVGTPVPFDPMKMMQAMQNRPQE